MWWVFFRRLVLGRYSTYLERKGTPYEEGHQHTCLYTHVLGDEDAVAGSQVSRG